MDFYIFFLVAVGLIAWLVFAYNRFIRLINRAKEAWSDIDVQMKRRYDLIPNLVSIVKGYAQHESGTFEKVVLARNMAMNAKTTKEHGEAENMLSSTLKSIFALSESYPDLKANTNFLELQRELSDTENKIQASRRFYNTNVRDLNTAIETFPSNLIARIFGFTKMEFFDLDNEVAKEPVKVSF
jgi:LemA protein